MQFPVYVYRDPHRIYHAYAPDFPDLAPVSASLGNLELAVQLAVANQITEEDKDKPGPSGPRALPPGIPSDGHWLSVDLGPVFGARESGNGRAPH